MTKYLFDTNIISELRKTRPHGGVLAWLNTLREDQIFLSAVTLGELQTGIERVREEDPAKAHEIERWVDALAESRQVLPMDTRCFREWARLMHGRPAQLLEDAMLAATARVHELNLATRNERDFKGLGVGIFNPFKPQGQSSPES